MNTEKMRLVAMRDATCAGNDSAPVRYHPSCNGEIFQGEQYIERNGTPEKYGTFHCLKCYEQFFAR